MRTGFDFQFAGRYRLAIEQFEQRIALAADLMPQEFGGQVAVGYFCNTDGTIGSNQDSPTGEGEPGVTVGGDGPGQWTYPNEPGLPSFTWVFDDENHVVTLQVHVHVNPANTTPEQVEAFEELLETQVEEHFNNNPFILVPNNGGDIWTPQIDVIIEVVSTGIDIELHNEEVQSSVNWDTPEQIDAVMNLEDLLYGDDEQVSAIHEFGHIIGCRHPGEPGGDDEYTADEDSLMGLGMELRPIYFAAWAVELSEHLPQNGPYGVGEQP